jgi:glucans biosynthesis protein
LLAAAGAIPVTAAAPVWAQGDPSAGALEAALNDGGFNFDRLTAVAQQLVTGQLRTPQYVVPQFARQLDYDQFRRIEFHRDKSLWREQGIDFQAQLAHPGGLYTEPVTVFEAVGGQVRQITFDPAMFNYHDPAIAEAAAAEKDALAFVGVRLLDELNYPGKWDEVVVFQGASYFRALGRNSRYGLSARGLAIDTGAPTGEEFPRFSAFVLERPPERSGSAVVYALLESPSVCGAYSFSISPGRTTTVDVEARLFARHRAEVLGLAPLTSMFAFGENDRVGVDDFRPEVHDSDGLMIRTGAGEVIWRPLINPGELQINSFVDHDPRGFGLLQRDRSFESYQDAEAHYERRPSCWVEPLHRWGSGSVRLIEIPTPHEYNDNIVAFWAPEGGLPADAAATYRYRLHWGDAVPPQAESASVVASRVGAINPQQNETTPTERRFVVDFEGGVLGNLPSTAPVETVASARNAEIAQTIAAPLPDGARWRAVIDARRSDVRPADLRCFLRLGDSALSETWSYLWT